MWLDSVVEGQSQICLEITSADGSHHTNTDRLNLEVYLLYSESITLMEFLLHFICCYLLYAYHIVVWQILYISIIHFAVSKTPGTYLDYNSLLHHANKIAFNGPRLGYTDKLVIMSRVPDKISWFGFFWSFNIDDTWFLSSLNYAELWYFWHHN